MIFNGMFPFFFLKKKKRKNLFTGCEKHSFVFNNKKSVNISKEGKGLHKRRYQLISFVQE
jgi:hypothetical protein